MKTTSDKNTLEVAIRRKDGTKILEIIRSQESVEDHVLAEIISRMGASDPVTVSAIIIDQKSKFSPNALGLAVISALKEGQGQIASLIMDDGIVLTSAQDANGITPLTAAAANGEEDFARKYLMGRISTEGVDALIAAAKANNKDFIQLLLENGVNVDAVNKTGATALMYAADFGNLDAVEFLLENGANVNAVDSSEKTALMYAAEYGRVDTVQFLLESNANLDLADSAGKTALMYAAEYGRVDTVQFLLESNANVDLVDLAGKTALMYAAENGNLYAVEFLLQNDAKVNAVDQSGATALMYAAENGNLYVIEFLLQNGADVNVKNKDGKSALMIIVDSGNLDLLQTLIDNKLGAKALEYAITSRNLEMVKACLDKGVNVETEVGLNDIITEAIISQNLDIMDLVFKKIPNTSIMLSSYKNLALNHAVDKGDSEMVKFFIEKGADVNSSMSSIPAISRAIMEGNPEITSFLLDQKALNVNVERFSQWNPLSIALQYKKADVLREMLFSKGGDPYYTGIITDFSNLKEEYEINLRIQTDANSKQVITEYLTLEREFREKFADKAKDRIANYEMPASLKDAYEEINFALKDLLEDSEKKFASAVQTEQIKIKLNFVDKFIIEIKELLGLSDKLDAAQERIMIRLEEKIYEAIKNSELFKKLSPELEGNVSVAKALDGIEGRFSKAGNIEVGEKSKAEQIAAERANKTNTEIRGK
jgi:ankyrin repeat protein